MTSCDCVNFTAEEVVINATIEVVEVNFRVDRPVINFSLACAGPRGPAGVDGEFTLIAGESVDVGEVVKSVGGQLFLASNNETLADAANVVGVVTTAAAIGFSADVTSSGEVSNPSWTLSDGLVYLGLNGQVTQTPPATGVFLKVGTAIDSTTLLVDIETPILRA